MKILWITWLVVLSGAVPAAAQAVSLEQICLAARDAHIRKLAVADKPGADRRLAEPVSASTCGGHVPLTFKAYCRGLLAGPI